MAQSSPFYGNLPLDLAQPMLCLSCRAVLSHTNGREPPVRCAAFYGGTPAVGVGVACRRHSLCVSRYARRYGRLNANAIGVMTSLRVSRSLILSDLHK
ncbi:hypothetical protein [Chamaesiphon minutus]|uniref:hypothetical protein n=1 Tax=Chamaesiphon minutus TaxID=1173032 RepID=UPI0012FCAA41|nr:hypothetical protein [Chamaesiphon minutus]